MPDVGKRLMRVVDQVETSAAVLVGGGAAADLVREWDERFSLSHEICHQLAIHGMQLNARLVASLADRFVFLQAVSDIEATFSTMRVPVLDPVALTENLHQRLPPDRHLPASWTVTSDSIAAWLAVHTGFDRLVLLKSATLPPDLPAGNIADFLCTAGLVDPYFPTASRRLHHLDWCDLRHNEHGALTAVW